MLQSTCRRFIPVFAAVLAISLPSVADFVFDDFEDGNGRNGLGEYWYYVVDGYGTTEAAKKAVVTNFADPFTPTASGGKGGGYGAVMNFTGLTGGTNPDASIAIGSGVTKNTDGIGSSFAGVTGVSFYAKGPAALTFRFVVETKEVGGGDGQSWDAYGKNETVANADANEWKKYSINFTQLGRVWDQTVKFDFNPAHVTKFSWQIKKSDNNTNGKPTSGTFAVDSVVLLGAFEAPSTGPVEVTGDSTLWWPNFVVPTPSALFSNFESDLKGALGYYWYTFAYGGAEIAKEKRDAGRSGAGNAAFGEFTVGAGAEGPVSVIGVDFYDDKATTKSYWDAKDFTGVYFEYKTTAGVNPLTVELHDKYSAENPESGLTFTVDLPGTSGEWKAAVVNFDKFKLPSWAEGEQKRNLGVTALAKLHFVYKGATSGSIGIDNVYFLGTGSFGGDEVEPPIVPPVVVDTSYVLKYIAGAGGKLSVAGVTKQEYDTTVVENGNGPAVTAVADEGYKFAKWSDGFAVAARTDKAVRDSTMTAQFEVVVPDSFTVTYNAGEGGSLLIGGEEQQTYVFKGEVGDAIPVTIEAVAGEGYNFDRWNDGVTTAAREVDVVTANSVTINAVFVPVPVEGHYTFTYIAGSNGSLTHGEDTGLPSKTLSLEDGAEGTPVTAVPDEDYLFVGWSDGVTEATRTDIAVRDSSVTAQFEIDPTSVAQTDRVIPAAPGAEIVVVAPVTVVAGEFTVGPNPAAKQSGEVRFFWSGRAVKSGKLAIFDASGNLVKKVNVGESASGRSVFGFARGAIGSWDLKDAKGRPVAEGTYLVKGVIVTQDGAKVKASAVLGVR